jgi:alkylation response protein AidB-like acyl-CoA dehydrogenase
VRFALDEDQEQLRDVLRGFLEEHASSEHTRKAIDTPKGYDPALWQRLARELDLVGINLPEQYGGSGSGFVELTVVARELGRVTAPGPFLPTVALAGQALMCSGDERAQQAWLPKIAAGDCVATLAVCEAGRSEPATLAGTPATRASAGDGGWTVSGTKEFVCLGAEADLLLVLADTDSGPGLFAVAGDAAGVHRESPTPFDLTRRLATVTLDGAAGEPVGQPGSGVDVTRAALDRAAIALANEQVGGAQRCLETATEYAKTRVQFNRPIGSFQAIKHMLADLLVEVESAAAAADWAAWTVDHQPEEVPHAAALAKAFAADTYLLASRVNIQVHGGIGFTWEHDAHLHFRRATSGKQLLGSPEEHREFLAGQLIDAG